MVEMATKLKISAESLELRIKIMYQNFTKLTQKKNNPNSTNLAQPFCASSCFSAPFSRAVVFGMHVNFMLSVYNLTS